jgi:hypothetical protein
VKSAEECQPRAICGWNGFWGQTRARREGTTGGPGHIRNLPHCSIFNSSSGPFFLFTQSFCRLSQNPSSRFNVFNLLLVPVTSILLHLPSIHNHIRLVVSLIVSIRTAFHPYPLTGSCRFSRGFLGTRYYYFYYYYRFIIVLLGRILVDLFILLIYYSAALVDLLFCCSCHSACPAIVLALLLCCSCHYHSVILLLIRDS